MHSWSTFVHLDLTICALLTTASFPLHGLLYSVVVLVVGEGVPLWCIVSLYSPLL